MAADTRQHILVRQQGPAHPGVLPPDRGGPPRAFHGFGSTFVGTAILPGATISPFGDESAGARELSTAIYREVVAGAVPAVPAKLAPVLPDLLWLAHLRVTLYWVIDTSPDQERTRLLVERSGVLLVHLACRRVRQQWVHVLAAGIAGVLSGVAFHLLVDIGGSDILGSSLLPVVVGVATAVGRASVIPLVPDVGARRGPVDDDFRREAAPR